jgi:tRNA (cmo5U34)-methyltransferase
MSTQEDDLTTGNAPAVGRWEFDEAVTDSFESMLQKSIPQYDVMREVVFRAADWTMDRLSYGGRTPIVVDLGASRGSALAPIVDRWGARARYLAAEVSDPMLAALEERFKGMIDAGLVDVIKHDLREGMPPRAGCAVVLSVLTLQFVPIEYRQTLLRQAYEALTPKGALILVEKVLGEADETNRLLVDLYYGSKREQGYTQEAIDRKRLALEGTLVPLTAPINEAWLRAAGFDLVEQLWGYLNFRAWIAFKR